MGFIRLPLSLLLACFLSATLAFGQSAAETFQLRLGTPANDYATGTYVSVTPTDTTYIVVGYTAPLNDNFRSDSVFAGTRGFIMGFRPDFDAANQVLNGADVIFSQEFAVGAGDNNILGLSIDTLGAADSLVIAGQVRQGGEVNLFVSKTDLQGNVGWTRILNPTVGFPEFLGNDPVKCFPDGSILVLGEAVLGSVPAPGLSTKGCYAARLNSDGGVIWQEKFGIDGLADIPVNTIANTEGRANAGLVRVTGADSVLYVYAFGLNDNTVRRSYRLSRNWTTGAAFALANPSTEYTYGSTNSRNIFSTAFIYTVGGVEREFLAGLDNASGRLQPLMASTTFANGQTNDRSSSTGFNGTADHNTDNKALNIGDTVFVQAATIVRSPVIDADFFLRAVNEANFSTRFNRYYGSPLGDTAVDVAQTPDNGFFMVGHTAGFNPVGGVDLYFVKTDADGNTSCNERNIAPANISTTTFNGLAALNTFNPPFYEEPSGASSVATPTLTNAPFTGANAGTENICCTGYEGVIEVDTVCIGAPSVFRVRTLPNLTESQFQVTYWDTLVAGGIPDYTKDTVDLSVTAGGEQVLYPTEGDKPVSVIVHDTVAFCRDTVDTSAFVDYFPIINIPQVDTSICFNDTIPLSARNLETNTTITTFNWSVELPGGDPFSLTTFGDSTTRAFPDSTTKYYFIASNVTGCVDSDSVSIKINALPVLSSNLAGNDTLVCPGSSVQLAIFSDSTIALPQTTNVIWFDTVTRTDNGGIVAGSDLGDSITVPGDSSRTYYVTVTDVNSCSSTDTIRVGVSTVGNLLPPGQDTLSYCLFDSLGFNTDQTINATIPGNPPGCTYDWGTLPFLISGSTTNPIVTVRPPTPQQYKIRLQCTLAGGIVCPADSDSVIVRPFGVPSVTTSPDIEVCINDTIRLSATGTNAADTLYEWLNFDTFASFAFPQQQDSQFVDVFTSTDAKFYVNVRNSRTTCVTLDSVELDIILEPTIGLPTDTTVCEEVDTLNNGDEFNIPAGYASYFWTPLSEISGNPLDVNANIVPTRSGFVFLDVVDTNGCRGRDSIDINFVPSPQTRINNQIIGERTICNGESIQLFATGGANHEFFDENGNPPPPGVLNPITVDTSDTITWFAVAFVGAGPNKDCPSTEGDTAQFTVNVVPQPSPSFTMPIEACVSEVVTVSYNDNYYVTPAGDTLDSLVWDFGNAIILDTLGVDSFLVTYPDTGTFVIQLTNIFEGLCEASDDRQITIYSNPIASAGSDKFTCRGEPVQLSGAFANVSGRGNCVPQWTPFSGLANPFDPTTAASPINQSKYFFSVNCNGCPSNIDSMEVFIDEPPTAQVDTFEVDFCAGGSSILPGRGSGGSGNYSFQWLPSAGLSDPTVATPTVTIGSSGTNDTTVLYRLLVSDVFTGCVSDTAFIQATSFAPPLVRTGPDTNLCAQAGQGIFLSGGLRRSGFGNFEFAWTPAATLSDSTDINPYAKPITSTTYTLRATNTTTGCISPIDDSSRITVDIRPRPIANAGPSDTVIICPTDSVTLGGVPSNVGPSPTFSWTPNAGMTAGGPTSQFPSVSPNQTTKYYVQVTDGNCVSQADSVVVQLAPSPQFAVQTPYTEICGGDSVRIGNTAVSGVSYQYLWSPAASLSDPTVPNPTAFPTSTTTYTLQVTANNCTSIFEDTVRVNVIEGPTFAPAQTQYFLCNEGNTSVQIVPNVSTNTPPIRYAWSPNIAIDDSTATNPIVSPTQTTVYTLRATAGQCTNEQEFEVVVQPGLNGRIVVQGGDSVLCGPGQRTLVATGGLGDASFFWLDDSTTDPTRTLNVDTTFTYRVRISEAGCVDTLSQLLTVLPPANADFTYSFENGCAREVEDGFEVAFFDNSQGAESWSWAFGDGGVSNERNPIHVYSADADLGKQSYRVTLRVGNEIGCEESQVTEEVITIIPRGEADFSSTPLVTDPIYLPNSTVRFDDESTGALTYLWDFGDGSTSRQPSPAHTYRQEGAYSVELTITDEAGCTDTRVRGPYRVLNETQLTTVFSPNGDGINDRWLPQLPGAANYRCFIYDRYGELVAEFELGDQGWDGTNQSGNDAPEGTYFYAVEVNWPDRQEVTIRKGQLTVLR